MLAPLFDSVWRIGMAAPVCLPGRWGRFQNRRGQAQEAARHVPWSRSIVASTWRIGTTAPVLLRGLGRFHSDACQGRRALFARFLRDVVRQHFKLAC
jgi:hypothetical protein